MIDNDWSEAERRQYERYSVDFYMCIYDQNTNVQLGQVVDISLGGMRLLSTQPFLIRGKRFRLRMEVSLESGKRENILLEARSVWGREDDNPDYYSTGFQFHDLSSETSQRIQEILDELSD
jgi:c-di-GMP-binding flagellar brake protein YcgR